MKKIVLAGEAYSRNLGDQAIHACLKWLLQHEQPGLEVTSLDLSGRQPGQATHSKKSLYQILRGFPGLERLQPLVNRLLFNLSRGRHTTAWSAALDGAQALVIGGGQLLMDNALDFPLKVSGLAGLAQRRHVPVYFSACGVGVWSTAAKRLFEASLRGAVDISLRDELSAKRLAQHLPGIACRVSADPAILVGEMLGMPARQPDPVLVGLVVMDRQDANSRLPQGKQFTSQAWMGLWSSIVRDLAGMGSRVRLLSTGSPQDQAFVEALWVISQEQRISEVERVASPAGVVDLLESLAGCRVVVGTRLHASILANAVGVPSLGLTWDEKVKAYYQEAGLAGRCLELVGLRPEDLVRVYSQVVTEGLPPALLNKMKEHARLNIIRF